MPRHWTTAEMPSQTGRSVVVTGTGGLGYECALALARAGATVILAGRNPAKGEASVRRILGEARGASVRFEQLDLASLASVRSFAARLRDMRGSLDILINNAGVMVPPTRRVTEDGFELQMGTNHLGHVALTALLLPLLAKGNRPRVVSLSSVAARQGAIDFDNLNAERSYVPMAIYAQSKLACLMFALELQRRSVEAGWGISSMAAHPGVSRTDLLHNAPGRWSAHGMARTFLWFLFQPPAQGALPALFAATSPEAAGGGYYGPNRLSETRGYPVRVEPVPQAQDEAVARRLFDASEALTGLRFAL
jgi:NAD(P)-dependent dehydrogenase (short-subunit alcohol dehydrogenase family)